MKISHLRTLLRETDLSPEQLGQRLQISGMTLRRLLKKDDGEPIPESYLALVRQGVYGLIIEGKLKPDSVVVQLVASGSPSRSFDAAIHALGFRQDQMALGGSHPEQMLIGLSEIGASKAHQEEVNENPKAFQRFRKLGREWAHRISTLRRVVTSRRLTQIEKMAAYGALFYLITVFDLIPDTIPVFGLLDDFSILGIVAAYYIQKFPNDFSTSVGP